MIYKKIKFQNLIKPFSLSRTLVCHWPIYSGKQGLAWEQPKEGPAGLKHKHMHKHGDMHTQTSEVIGNKSNSQLRDVFLHFPFLIPSFIWTRKLRRHTQEAPT